MGRVFSLLLLLAGCSSSGSGGAVSGVATSAGGPTDVENGVDESGADERGEDGGPATLKEAAAGRGVEIGVAFDGWQFDADRWREVVAREFSRATVQWGVYWSTSEPVRGVFDFAVIDRQVEFAQERGFTIRGHALVFPEVHPEWLTAGDFSDAELIDILREHITAIMKRYRGTVAEWVVVNEPFLAGSRPHDVFYDRFGYDYIDHAFEAAREADPSATLMYSDTDNHLRDSATTALTREVLARLRSKGLVDAVALQLHLSAAERTSAAEVLQVAASYGVPFHFTEVDVDLRDVRSSTTERLRLQADVYEEMLGACLDTERCQSFTLWGINDHFSWLEWPQDAPGSDAAADPTPFDDNLEPKAAYFAMLEVLRRG